VSKQGKKFSTRFASFEEMAAEIKRCKVCGKECEGEPQNGGIVTMQCRNLWAFVEGYPVHLSHRIGVKARI
jgi:hypothetical protein